MTTLAELEATPTGTKVLVDGVEWEKAEAGLARDGTVLNLFHFTGYLADNRVVIGNPWQVRRWYVVNHDAVYITHREGDQIHALRWDGEAVHPVHRNWSENAAPGSLRLVPVDGEQTWMKRLAAMYDTPRVPENLVAALHNYAAEVDDGEFDELLAEHSIGRMTEHSSCVTITGSSDWTPDITACTNWLGADFVVDSIDDAVTIYWSRTVTVTNTGVGCTCGAVDRDQVSPYVPGSVNDFDWEVECG